MKTFKNLFTTLLLLCATVATAHDFETGGIYYNITDATNKTVKVTSYSSSYTGSVVIPESVTYNGTTYSVTSIEDWAFSGCTGLTSIEIPNSVTSIGNYAFSDCSGLTSIEVDGNNTKYDSRENCNAIIETATNELIVGCQNTIIPNSVTSIGDNAFYECTGLTSITIPNSITSIVDYAFYYCTGLTSITIPNSVTSIGYEAFRGCTGLEKVCINDLAAWCGIDFASANANPLYYAKNLYLNDELVTALVIPDNVTNIRDYAFYNCSELTSIEIPNSVTSIGSCAFEGCTGLTSITIPNSVTSIGERAFYDTAWYNNQPNGVVYAGRVLYRYKGIMPSNTSITIKDGTLGIAGSAFYYCTGLTSITIPNSVTSIGSSAFSGCTGLTSVVIPNSVTSIENYAFSGCTGLTSIEVESGNSVYDSRENCNAIIETATNELIVGCQNTIIPSSVTSIGGYAFYNCTGLTNITIPNSVTSIRGRAFYNCTGLTSITIPNSVTSIEDWAFSGCTGLTSITIPNSVTSIGNYAFRGCTGLTSITIPNSVTSIGERAFEDCIGLTSITIPNSVTTIGNYAFRGCTGLTSITIPNSVTSIGYEAFRGCTGLTSVTIGNSVTSIGSSAFYGCSGLKTVINISNLTFSKGSTENGYVAYYAVNVYNVPNGCLIEDDFIFGKPNDVNTLLYYLGNATELTLPANYKGGNYTIGANVFKGNTTITSITIPNSVTSIGSYAFDGCISLTCIEIPNSVTSIGDYAFYKCTGFTSIEIVDGIKNIGYSAFKGCNNLETLYISNTIESINNYAFAECINILDIKIGSKKAITASENIFSTDTYNNACLYVPEGRKFAYEKATPWNNFYIAEMDFTGIENVKGESGTDGRRESKVKGVYYDLSGRVVENPTNGIYIINGKKVFVK